MARALRDIGVWTLELQKELWSGEIHGVELCQSSGFVGRLLIMCITKLPVGTWLIQWIYELWICGNSANLWHFDVQRHHCVICYKREVTLLSQNQFSPVHILYTLQCKLVRIKPEWTYLEWFTFSCTDWCMSNSMLHIHVLKKKRKMKFKSVRDKVLS